MYSINILRDILQEERFLTLQFQANAYTHQLTQYHSHWPKNIIEEKFELSTLFGEPTKFWFLNSPWGRGEAAAFSLSVVSLGCVCHSHALWRTFLLSLHSALGFSAPSIYSLEQFLWDNHSIPKVEKLVKKMCKKKWRRIRVINLYHFTFYV